MKKILSVITISLFLLGCGSGGGDSSDTSGNSSSPSPTTNQQDNQTALEKHFDEIAVKNLLLPEAVIDLSEVVESEMLWIFDIGNQVTSRQCLDGGTVSWDINWTAATKLSGNLSFDECNLGAFYPADKTKAKSSNVYFSGMVSVDFNVTLSEEYTGVNSVEYYSLVTKTDAAFLRSKATEGLEYKVAFDFSISNHQSWNDEQNDKRVEIQKLIVDFADNDSSGDTVIVSNGVLEQSQFIPQTTSLSSYEVAFSGDVDHNLYAVSGVLSGKLSGKDISNILFSEMIKGEFVYESEETLKLSIVDGYSKLFFKGLYEGEILTNELIDETLYRVENNRMLFGRVDATTPLRLLNTKLERSNEELATITATYNKSDLGFVTTYLSSVGEVSNVYYETDQISMNQERNKLVVDLPTDLVAGVYELSISNKNFSESGNLSHFDQTDKVVFVHGFAGDISILEYAADNILGDEMGEFLTMLGSTVTKGELLPSYTDISNFSAASEFCFNSLTNEYFLLDNESTQNTLYALKLEEYVSIERHDIPHSVKQLDCMGSYLSLHGVEYREANDGSFKHLANVGTFDTLNRNYEVLKSDLDESHIADNTFDNNHYAKHVFPDSHNEFYTLDHDAMQTLKLQKVDYSLETPIYTDIKHVTDSLVWNHHNSLDCNARTQFSESYSYDRKSLMDINEQQGYLIVRNIVMDLDSEEIIHEFNNTNLMNCKEHLLYLDNSGKYIVTDYGVYDAKNFELLAELPLFEFYQSNKTIFIGSDDILRIIIGTESAYNSSHERSKLGTAIYTLDLKTI